MFSILNKFSLFFIDTRAPTGCEQIWSGELELLKWINKFEKLRVCYARWIIAVIAWKHEIFELHYCCTRSVISCFTNNKKIRVFFSPQRMLLASSCVSPSTSQISDDRRRFDGCLQSRNSQVLILFSTFHINVVCRSHFLRVSHACHLASVSEWKPKISISFLHDGTTMTRPREASRRAALKSDAIFFSLVKIYIYGILYKDDSDDGRPRPELMMMMKTNFIIFVSMREVVE